MIHQRIYHIDKITLLFIWLITFQHSQSEIERYDKLENDF